jgi:hypothetical protein
MNSVAWGNVREFNKPPITFSLGETNLKKKKKLLGERILIFKGLFFKKIYF